MESNDELKTKTHTTILCFHTSTHAGAQRAHYPKPRLHDSALEIV